MLLAASCTSTDYIDVDQADPIIVMNAQISTMNSSHAVLLSESKLSEITEVSGADVTVSVNGGAPINATEDKSGEEEYGTGLMNGTKYLFDYNFAPGDKVEIKANCKSIAAVDAMTTVPKDPVIKNVEIFHEVPHKSSNSMFDFGNGFIDEPYYSDENDLYPLNSWHQLKITLQDIPEEDSYYRLDVLIEYTLQDGEKIDKGTYGVSLDTASEPVLSSATSSNGGLLEALLEESNRYNAFSDNIFKDKEYTLNLFFQESQVNYIRHYYSVYDTDWTEVEVKDEKTGQTYTKYVPEPLPEGVTYKTEMIVRLYSISHDQYIYIKALDLNDMAIFFSEPISIPSNVEGGMGFVSIDSCKEKRLDY